MVSKVRGVFTRFSGELNVAENVLDSAVTATVDMTSIDTRRGATPTCVAPTMMRQAPGDAFALDHDPPQGDMC